MAKSDWLQRTTPAFRLMIATSWLAPETWRTKQVQAMQESISEGPDWNEFVRLVDRHRTPALAYAALQTLSGHPVPEATMKQLQERNRSCRARAIMHCQNLALILRSFKRAALPVMNLKGPILSDRLYGDVGLRQSNDLDLVVTPDNVNRALSILNELGWQLEPGLASLTPRQWKKFHQMSDDLSLVHRTNGSVIELHSRIYWDSAQLNMDRWTRSIQTSWQGLEYRTLQPLDELLFLCAHGGYHGWFRAKWLGDMARIFTQEKTDWEKAFGNARETGMERILLACRELLHIVHGLPLPDLPADRWDRIPAILIQGPLHALEIPHEPTEHGLLELLHDLNYAVRYPVLTQAKTWGQTVTSLLYCRHDYQMIRIPDRFFWTYAPLRPVLLLWRKIKRLWFSRYHIASSDFTGFESGR